MGPGLRGQARPPALLELSDEEDQGMASCSRSWSWAVGGLQCCGLQCAVVDCGLTIAWMEGPGLLRWILLTAFDSPRCSSAR